MILSLSLSLSQFKAYLDWEREGGEVEERKIELAKNRLILCQFFSTLL